MVLLRFMLILQQFPLFSNVFEATALQVQNEFDQSPSDSGASVIVSYGSYVCI